MTSSVCGYDGDDVVARSQLIVEKSCGFRQETWNVRNRMSAGIERVILWDIDKTLLQSDKRVNLFDNAFESLFGHPKPEEARIDKSGKVDGQIAREYLAIENSDDFCGYMDALNRISVDYYTANPLACVPGIPEILKATRAAGSVNGLYTGNTRERAQVKLTTAGIAPKDYFDGFERGAAFCQGYTSNRLDGVKDVRDRFTPDQLLVVGDTQRDHDLALALGCAFWQVGSSEIRDDDAICVGKSDDFEGEFAQRFLAIL